MLFCSFICCIKRQSHNEYQDKVEIIFSEKILSPANQPRANSLKIIDNKAMGQRKQLNSGFSLGSDIRVCLANNFGYHY